MKSPVLLSTLFIVTAFAGCDSSDIISLPKPEPRLVVNSIGVSEHEWHAVVSPSESVLYTDFYKQIEDAAISIYENGAFSETLSFKRLDDNPLFSGWYISEVSKPKPGNVYKIVVEHPDYPVIESEYKQPESIEIQSVEIKNPHLEKYRFGVRITIGFDDPPGENYYEVSAVASDSARTFSLGGYLTFIDPVYKEYSELFLTTAAFDDVYFNGKSAKLEFDFYTYSNPPNDISNFTIYIHHISKDYYQYLKTTKLQNNSVNDPFAQPVLISNNIRNGYGLFGGYTETSKTVNHEIDLEEVF